MAVGHPAPPAEAGRGVSAEPAMLAVGTPVHIDVPLYGAHGGRLPAWGVVEGTAGGEVAPPGALGVIHVVRLVTGERIRIVRCYLSDVGALLGPRIVRWHDGRGRHDFHTFPRAAA